MITTAAGAVARASTYVSKPRTELLRLLVRDFRNIESLELQLPGDGMVILGDNAQGKTNLLEAARYTTIFRSARGAPDVDLVRYQAAGFFLAATARQDADIDVTVGFDAASREKRVVVDGRRAVRLSDAFGCIPSVLLSPDDVQLISGGPGDRRRYLDVLLSLVDHSYLNALQNYRAALQRRNAALREITRRGGDTRDEDRAAVWEPMLAQHGAQLWRSRSVWCGEAAGELEHLGEQLGERGRLKLEHVAHAAGDDLSAEKLATLLETHRASDIRRGNTSSGPHRDDLRISLDGRDLRLFGSGGQQRTAAVALRLLETLTICDRRRRWPVLLLDDPFAELDKQRASRILRLLQETIRGQVILAVPRDDEVPPELTRLARYRMRGGVLHEVSNA
jgi:DNA replication and repair protein RecF